MSRTVGFSEVAEMLLGASSVTVVTHIRPDADAIGSACAMTLALRTLGKDVATVIGQPHPFPENLACIPASGDIELTDQLPEADIIITLDCASLDRTGSLAPAIEAVRDKVIVIDHHKSNPGFGGYNLIKRAESTTTLLRELFLDMGVELNHDIAYALYSGLVTDTGSFRWGSPHMHTLASELMTYGIDSRQVAMNLMDQLTATDLRLIGEVLAGIQHREAGGLKLAILLARRALLDEMSQTGVEMLIDYVRVLQGTDIGVVFKEMRDGTWSVSLRSSTVDVSEVAKRLSGGGHKPAAGYSAEGSAESIVDKLIEAL